MCIEEEVELSTKEMSNTHTSDRTAHNTNNRNFINNRIIQMISHR